jgi:hypothetical protein
MTFRKFFQKINEGRWYFCYSNNWGQWPYVGFCQRDMRYQLSLLSYSELHKCRFPGAGNISHKRWLFVNSSKKSPKAADPSAIAIIEDILGSCQTDKLYHLSLQSYSELHKCRFPGAGNISHKRWLFVNSSRKSGKAADISAVPIIEDIDTI